MAAGGTICRYSPMDISQENAEVRCSEGSALHERLVAYVRALEQGCRRGVWGEHSYARAVGEPARRSRRTRLLLAPRPPDPPSAPVDVDGPPDAWPGPPSDGSDAEEEEDGDGDAEEWEARVEALAPSAAHARAARAVCDALRRMRLERLVARGVAGGGGGGGEQAREQARALAAVLRRALAPLWGAGGGAWLQGALAAAMPRAPRRLYAEAVEQLRAAAPHLAERLTGAWAPAPRPPRPRAWGPPLGPDAGPWLVWVSSGCAALDARWDRRLSALMHTRVLRGAGAGAGDAGEGAAAPEAWCAAAAGAVRSQLTDALAEAGERGIILGGVGSGAALCAVLARGAGGAGRAAGGVRGALLLAPALRTAEGEEDALRGVRLPLLLVVGERAATAPHALANQLAECGARRLLVVRGADAELRVPRRLRRRLRLPQHALDAALAEECVRWALDTAEGEEAPPSPPAPDPASPPSARRHPLPTIVHRIDLDAPDEDYAHLPAAAAPATTPHSAQSARSIEIVEGRVVSRAAGGTPLPLLPPRAPAPPAPPPAPPSPADIMQMPIVFADDTAAGSGAGADSSSTGSPVTVTSGKARGSCSGTLALTPSVSMTRVIVAKRGARAPPPRAWGPPRAPPPAHRLLLRRGVRVIARRASPPAPHR